MDHADRTTKSPHHNAPPSIIMVTNSEKHAAPTELTDELRRLGFRKLPTAEEARRELSTTYAHPILTSAQAFERWCQRNLPVYQKHKAPLLRVQVQKNVRTKARLDMIRAQRGIAPAQKPLQSTESRKRHAATELQGSSKRHRGNEEGEQTASEEDIRIVSEAYKVALDWESISNCYSKEQYLQSYNSAYDSIANPLRSAWRHLISSTVDEKQAREQANKNGREAVKSFGGPIKVMRLGIQEDKKLAEALGMELSDSLAPKSTWGLPEGYTKEQWKASVTRTHRRFWNPAYRVWESKYANGMSEEAAKREASQQAQKAVAEVGDRRMRIKALEDDLDKAEAAGLTLEQWLANWSDDIAKKRAKIAEKKAKQTRGAMA